MPLPASPEDKNMARNLYVFRGIACNAIAKQMGVTQQAVLKWKRRQLEAGDDWDAARKAAMVAKGGLENVLQKVTQELCVVTGTVLEDLNRKIADEGLEGVPVQEKMATLAAVADALTKARSATRGMSPKIQTEALIANFLQVTVDYFDAKGEAEVVNVFFEHFTDLGFHLRAKFASTD